MERIFARTLQIERNESTLNLPVGGLNLPTAAGEHQSESAEESFTARKKNVDLGPGEPRQDSKRQQ